MYFTADPHFNHARIIELCQRPFLDLAAMHATLIERWNATVQADHEPVYVLGDFAFWYVGAESLDDIFTSLRGEKHLIIGNHDEQNPKVLRLPWKTTSHLAHLRYGADRFVACHFPIENWWHKERGVLHVHGHCHGSARVIPHRFDVGVDVCDFAPVSAETLIEQAAEQAFVPKDHHIKHAGE